MRNMAYHAVVGNDAPPWVVSLARGFLHAIIAGGVSFLSVWQATDEIKVLVAAGVTPFLTVLGTRFLGEGFLDTVRNQKGRG